MLNELYDRFDALLLNHFPDAWKVDVIGDCVMIVCNLTGDLNDHVDQCIDLGLMMVEEAKKVDSRVEKGAFTPLHVRVGLHTGPAVAGIIGGPKKHKTDGAASSSSAAANEGQGLMRFTVLGDAVNTAARMESHGVQDKVHLSAASFSLLSSPSVYEIQARGIISIKGKGQMKTFLVSRRRSSSNLEVLDEAGGSFNGGRKISPALSLSHGQPDVKHRAMGVDFFSTQMSRVRRSTSEKQDGDQEAFGTDNDSVAARKHLSNSLRLSSQRLHMTSEGGSAALGRGVRSSASFLFSGYASQGGPPSARSLMLIGDEGGGGAVGAAYDSPPTSTAGAAPLRPARATHDGLGGSGSERTSGFLLTGTAPHVMPRYPQSSAAVSRDVSGNLAPSSARTSITDNAVATHSASFETSRNSRGSKESRGSTRLPADLAILGSTDRIDELRLEQGQGQGQGQGLIVKDERPSIRDSCSFRIIKITDHLQSSSPSPSPPPSSQQNPGPASTSRGMSFDFRTHQRPKAQASFSLLENIPSGEAPELETLASFVLTSPSAASLGRLHTQSPPPSMPVVEEGTDSQGEGNVHQGWSPGTVYLRPTSVGGLSIVPEGSERTVDLFNSQSNIPRRYEERKRSDGSQGFEPNGASLGAESSHESRRRREDGSSGSRPLGLGSGTRLPVPLASPSNAAKSEALTPKADGEAKEKRVRPISFPPSDMRHEAKKGGLSLETVVSIPAGLETSGTEYSGVGREETMKEREREMNDEGERSEPSADLKAKVTTCGCVVS